MVMQAKVSIDRINKFLNSEDLDSESITRESDENAIRITDGSFSWIDDTLVLKNINLVVKRGASAAVVGTVGSGKSSLISSILGETKKLAGTINIDGTLAFVAQQAWIQNATLKVRFSISPETGLTELINCRITFCSDVITTRSTIRRCWKRVL